MKIADEQKAAIKKYFETAEKIFKAYSPNVIAEVYCWYQVGYCQGGKK